ncbi:hypothetical protein PHOBOS_168 [Erwinia phage vB_EamM_Phobos]|uniref:hypothetical protein n=1 Tax=Erwinia phage vB_EamM_Phobos TaxID=1883377 RepID=UPI00081CBCE4|nr:hypothetical protein BIZ79_gp168 [Erwinia phage vB_EamM_Phobos]ANZ50358.1 hypothetical protein PHOBOS_168 [Erwinia phage vB_EamM_Phobos]
MYDCTPASVLRAADSMLLSCVFTALSPTGIFLSPYIGPEQAEQPVQELEQEPEQPAPHPPEQDEEHAEPQPPTHVPEHVPAQEPVHVPEHPPEQLPEQLEQPEVQPAEQVQLQLPLQRTSPGLIPPKKFELYAFDATCASTDGPVAICRRAILALTSLSLTAICFL